jgi:membrane fusion protein (multidrug efflux system)
MNTRTLYPNVAVVVAVVLALAACGSSEDGGKQAAAAAPPPTEVDVVTVATSPIVLTRDLPGRLEAYRSAQVRAQVEGIVEKRLFKEGSDVKAGATLFQIDYDLAEAKFKQAEAAMSRAQLDFDNTRVPAPIDGRIGRALVTEGALVGRGEATLLATIEQVNPIYANFIQPGSDVLRLQQAFQSGKMQRTGSAKVELILEDGSIYSQPGKLLFSNLAVDSSTGSVSLRAEFPNAKHELLPGMFVRVRFPEGRNDHSIRVPQRAVQMSAQGQSVMVVDEQGKAAPRPVMTGDMVGGDFVIEEGLQPGDRVIVNGLQKIRPGAPVKAVEWNPGENSPAPNAPAVSEKK